MESDGKNKEISEEGIVSQTHTKEDPLGSERVSPDGPYFKCKASAMLRRMKRHNRGHVHDVVMGPRAREDFRTSGNTTEMYKRNVG